MKRGIFLAIIAALLLIFSYAAFFNSSITGIAVSDGPPADMGVPGIGPSSSDIACMTACTTEKCSADDMACKRAEGSRCQAKCNVYKPEQTEEESCVEACAMQGCDEFDFECQRQKQAECDRQCGMVGEPEAKSEEEACIRECVKKVDPALRCSGGPEGETGNEICQRCADECVHLYAGPCLNDEQIREKEKECQTCEHCYGEPVMGDSGEGYECIVDIECMDASAEWGDEPGEGQEIGQERSVARTTERISNVFEKAVGFFKGLFGIGEEETPSEEMPSGEEINEPGKREGMSPPSEALIEIGRKPAYPKLR